MRRVSAKRGGDERMQDREHLRLVVEAAPIAIVVADGDGRITLVNNQGEALFGYDRDELLGRSVEALVPERFRRAHPALRGNYLEAPSTRPMGAGRDLYGLRKDGSEVPIEIGLNPVDTPQGHFTLAAIIDITERKAAEEMRLQRDRALDASSLKSLFVATMSHELRTPLNAIIGMAELLGTTQLDERQRSFVETIDESAEALLGIISSILDLSKIEAGKLDLGEHDFDVAALVEGAAGVLAQQAREKDIALRVEVDSLLPPLVRGDGDRLRQILLNLVGNAVKFTARGRIVVRAFPLQTSRGSAPIRFEVEDTGPGIAPEVLPKLFEPFVQADSSTSRRYGGTGLGLSISKRLVELMGGQIGVESEPRRGSLFWFTAPLLPASTELSSGRASRRPSADDAIRRGVRVLIAEDNASLREVLEQQFARFDVDLTIVPDGAQAVETVVRDDFDVIFMDVHMPNVDGFAATRAIRARERTTGTHVPIVAMTANAFKEDREACLAAGMDDYLSKPVRMNDLRSMLERWAQRAPARTAQAEG